MLRNSDLLIAVADVLHRSDLGITGMAICSALRAGRPVIWIDPSRPTELRWLGHLSEHEFAEQLRESSRMPRSVPDIIPDAEGSLVLDGDSGNREEFVLETLGRKVRRILDARRAATCSGRKDFRRGVHGSPGGAPTSGTP